jgi:hypothetical protein
MTINIDRPSQTVEEKFPPTAVPERKTHFIVSVNGTTRYELPIGYKPKGNVYLNGSIIKPGVNDAYVFEYDGIRHLLALDANPNVADIAVEYEWEIK